MWVLAIRVIPQGKVSVKQGQNESVELMHTRDMRDPAMAYK